MNIKLKGTNNGRDTSVSLKCREINVTPYKVLLLMIWHIKKALGIIVRPIEMYYYTAQWDVQFQHRT